MREDFNAALALILYFIDENYRASHPNISESIGIEKAYSQEVLQLATRNKVSYYFAKRVLQDKLELDGSLKAIVELGERNIAKVRETLKFVSSLFTHMGLEFLVIKTLKGFPFITEDIDIIVKERDYQCATHVLESRGASKNSGRLINVIFNLGLGVPDYKLKELLKLDLYKTIPYPGLKSFDEEFLWRNPRLVDIYDVRCLVPSCEADLLTLISSTLFTDAKFTLLDFLYINSLFENTLNFEETFEQTQKYRWDTQFLKLVSVLQTMQKRIYRSEFIPSDVIFPFEASLSIILPSLIGLIQFKEAQEPTSLFSTFAHVGFHSLFSRIYVDVTRSGSTSHRSSPEFLKQL